jgi:acetylornithine deacetylase/succinyl-diaminopimelate desuccinylase-like protein
MPRLLSPRRLLGALAVAAAAVAPHAAPAQISVTVEPRRQPRAIPLERLVRQWRVAREPAILREFADFLAIPNVASDSANIRRNAAAITQMFAARGVKMQLLEGGDGPPAVYGEIKSPGAKRTVVLYAHYDGQPVSSEGWTFGPWTPTLVDGPLEAGGKRVEWPTESGQAGPEWRIYARSAGDDKAPIIAILSALDALRIAREQPSVNLKFFFEGGEEAGSPNLRAILERHKALLAADAWLFLDGPVHQTRRAQVVFGVRGVTGLELTVYGPARALHSGHYGNWAPNPIAELSGLMAGLRDTDGRVLIERFYDDVREPTAAERRAVAAAPSPDAALREELALGRTEADGAPLGERIMLPALNFRAVRGGGPGANAVPTEATASIDFRLVPNQTPARVRELVEAHLRAKGYHVVHDTPSAEVRRRHPRVVRLAWEPGYPALRTAMDLPVSRAVVRAVAGAAGLAPVEVPTLGGSLPLFHFGEVLGAPVITLPIADHDDNQHAPNENLRLQNLWDGIEMFAALFARLGAEWK